MRHACLLLIAFLAIGCGKNASQPAAPQVATDGEDDNEPRVAARRHFGTPVVFSADGKFALTGTSLYELATGKLVQQLQERVGTNSCALSPDGKTALSANREGTVTLWKVGIGKAERTFVGHQDEVDCVAFFPDGKRALSAGRDGTIRIWDLATGAQLQVLSTGALVSSLAISPNGRLAASVCGPFRMWDIAKGEVAWEFGKRGDGVSAAAFSPDGKRVVLGGKRIRVCEATTGNLVTLLDLGVSVWSVAFLPDGEHILTTGEDGLPRLWDLKGGRIEQNYHWTGEGVGYVAASPEGKQAIFDTFSARILWDLATDEGVATLSGRDFGADASGYLMAFSPDGRWALTAPIGGDPVLWDVATGKRLRTFTEGNLGACAFTFSRDGKLALSASGFAKALGIVQLWDVETGKQVGKFEGHKAPVFAVDFSPDGTQAISAGNNGPKLWEISTGKEILSLEGHKSAVHFVGFLRDGKRALSADSEGVVNLWEVSTGKLLGVVPSKGARQVTLSPDWRLALFYGGGRGSRSTVWDMTPGKEVCILPAQVEGVASRTALSSDGQSVLFIGSGGLLHLMDVTTGKTVRVAPPKGILTGEWAIAFSPDGRLARLRPRIVEPLTGETELTRIDLYELKQLRLYPDS